MQKEGEPESGPRAEPSGGEGEPEESRVWPRDAGHRGGHHAPGERSSPGMWGGTPGMHSSFLAAGQLCYFSLLNIIINNYYIIRICNLIQM